MTTQFVVGATADTDNAILTKASELYAGGGLHHAHFSAFRPIRDTPLEARDSTPPLREHRLYQADHLMRQYGFGRGELVFDSTGNLPLAHDPKLAWALAHAAQFPLDVLRASYRELVRVPGIGPVVARRIVEQRRSLTLRGVADLRALGVVMTRAAGFLTVRGRRLAADRWLEQLSLWDAASDAGVPRTVYEFSPGTFR